MQFLTVPVGDPDLAFISDTTIAAPFAFPLPVRRVHCVLQGLDLTYPENDHHVREVRIEPQIEFDELVSPTSGQIRVHFAWRDDGSGLGSGRISTLYARFLVIGE